VTLGPRRGFAAPDNDISRSGHLLNDRQKVTRAKRA
jgi:hypothetical protein